jgi:DNA-binding transcriptional MocR family regulator
MTQTRHELPGKSADQRVFRLGRTARSVCEYLRDTGGASCREVADGLGANGSTIKGMLQELERKGFVVRQGHYRGRFVLTGKGVPPESPTRPRRRRRVSIEPAWPACDPVVEHAMRAMARCSSTVL